MSSNQKSFPKQMQEFQTVDEYVKKSNGESFIRRYSKGRFLGKGGFARVYEFINLESKQVYAGKVIEKQSLTKARFRQKLMSEIKIHRSLDHSNVVKFEHFFEDPENVYILLELCPNQTLSELVQRRKRLTEIETQCYLLQLILALQYLHKHKIIHRDIKLGNLFLNEKLEIKLGDFGLASKLEFEGERKRTICGTPNYIAPEILDSSTGHSFEVDIWSLGVLAYTLLIGKPPFETQDIKTTYRRIKTNAYAFPEHVQISAEAKTFISQILVTEPHLRPGLDDILSLDFFTKNTIPRNMPLSSLAIPPSAIYLKHFANHDDNQPPQTMRSRKNSEKCICTEEQAENIPVISELPRDSGKGVGKCEKQALNTEPAAEVRNSEGSKRTEVVSVYQGIDKGPDIWVKKWVDYSAKYGIGYLLSNYSVGVYFNDSSKLVSDSVGASFKYQPRNSPEELSYKIDSIPQELRKKFSLLDYFRKHLLAGTDEKPIAEPGIFVKKFIQTAHASFFRLSNKVVQVRFLDKSELLLCSKSKHIVYINKIGEYVVSPINTAMETGGIDMTKRLRYTKEILSAEVTPGN